MRASFATTIFAVTPLLLSQAIAAPTPNFLSNIFSGNNKAAAETQTANIDVPWHFLNIYIFPKRSEDDDVQLRFRFSDDNPGNEISVACSKKASSIEDLHMERYERCGDSDVSFRYQSGKIEVMRNTIGFGRAQIYGETAVNLRPLGDGTFYQNEAFISPVQYAGN